MGFMLAIFFAVVVALASHGIREWLAMRRRMRWITAKTYWSCRKFMSMGCP